MARRHGLQIGGAILAGLLTAGCASLPTTGPTASRIVRAAASPDNHIGYTLVDIAPDTLPMPAEPLARTSTAFEAIAAAATRQRTDTIRRGDTLAINVYEVGVALFGSGSANPLPAEAGGAANPVANAQRIVVAVDEDGVVALPYLGAFQAAGATPAMLSAAIQRQLRAYSQSPQAVVTIADSVENVVYLTGPVARPGRYRLTAARERLLDMVALAGGVVLDPDDAEIRLARGSAVATVALPELHAESAANLVAQPGDRIEIVRHRRTFTVLGASDQVAEIPFATQHLSLAEAVARARGPADNRANPAGVFLFRYEADGSATGKPVIYRLDLMKTENYFLAQRFEMRDKDMLYFANAGANLPSKFINLLNQLVSPAVTARVLTQ